MYLLEGGLSATLNACDQVHQIIKANLRVYEKIKTKRYSNVLLRETVWDEGKKLPTMSFKDSVLASIWAMEAVPKASWLVAWYHVKLMTKDELEAVIVNYK